MSGTLFVVATPIGNLEDMTDRAKRVLSEVDIVASEDTRTAQKLFNILGIKNKTVSNHKFNEKKQADFLISALEKGENIAIVSDAGTPCISDPGSVIVKAAIEHGITVESIPGASSVITALSICGMDFNSFSFYGFLPVKRNEIKKSFDDIKNIKGQVAVFFESPKRIKKTLAVLVNELPEAKICLCNDLTKLYERVYRGSPENVLAEILENPAAEKGEYTLIIGKETGNNEMTDLVGQSPRLLSPPSLESQLIDHIVKNDGSMKEAVNFLAVKYKGTVTKKEFYAASLALKEIFSEQGI